MKRRTFIQRLLIGASAAMAMLYAPPKLLIPVEYERFCGFENWTATYTNVDEKTLVEAMRKSMDKMKMQPPAIRGDIVTIPQGTFFIDRNLYLEMT